MKKQILTKHLCSLWMSRPTGTRRNKIFGRSSDETSCEEAVRHWCGQSQNRDKTWWRKKGIHVAGSLLWLSWFCQQNWDNVNCMQLFNSKYIFFHQKKKEKEKRNSECKTCLYLSLSLALKHTHSLPSVSLHFSLKIKINEKNDNAIKNIVSKCGKF